MRDILAELYDQCDNCNVEWEKARLVNGLCPGCVREYDTTSSAARQYHIDTGEWPEVEDDE